MSRSSTIVGLVAACALAVLGCKQGIGGRCEINSDCSSGFCQGSSGAGPGGTCQDLNHPTTTGQGGSGGATENDGSAGGAGGADAGGAGGTDAGEDTPAGTDGAADDTASPADTGIYAPSVADDASAAG